MRKFLFALLLSIAFWFTPACAQTITQTYVTNQPIVFSAINLSQSSVDTQTLQWRISPAGAASCSLALDSSPDGVTWTAGGAIATQTCTNAGEITNTATVANYVRVDVLALSPSETLTVIYVGRLQSVGAGGSLPQVLSHAGNFTATSSDLFQVELTAAGVKGSCNSGEQTIIGGGKVNSAITGIACTPTAYSGLGFVAGLSGYAQLNASTGGQFANPIAAGEWDSVRVAANGRGENTDDVYCVTGLTTCIIYGREFSVGAANTSDSGAGILIDNLGSATTPSGNFFAALEQPSGGGEFNEGYKCANAANSTFLCLHLGTAVNPATGSQSQEIELDAANSSGTILPYTFFTAINGNGLPRLATNQFADVDLGVIITNLGAFSNVTSHYTCNSVELGGLVTVTDSTTSTVGATISGGGSDKVLGICNSAGNWVVFFAL